MIIGISLVLSYSMFQLNWLCFDSQMTYLDLWQEANQIFEVFHMDGRAAKEGIVSGDQKSVQFVFHDNSIVEYKFDPGNTLSVTRLGQSRVFANIDSSNSSFESMGDNYSVQIVLALTGSDAGAGLERGQYLEVSSEVCFRNY